MKALIVKQPWIDYLLNGEKVWEIRSSNSNIRGTVGLIQSGTGKIFGTIELVDSILLDEQTYFSSKDKHCIPTDGKTMPYKKTHAWVMKNPKRFETPIPYNHPLGAVIWVNVPDIE